MTIVDFQAAAKRHYHDACLLKDQGCKPNAGQLFGFAAECGLKALFVCLNYPTKANGDLERGDPLKGHVNQLLDKISILQSTLEVTLSGRNGSKYATILPTLNQFSNWKSDHRYYSEGAIPDSLDVWKAAAEDIQNTLKQAHLDNGGTL